jgi:enoyl-CoA hydratase/carnithine racemase
MNPYLLAINESNKPIVAVVRGGCIGIAFTMLSLVDFVYVAPDAFFMTPFMKTFQSPEGTSTASFPEIFGKRKAAELLMLDKPLTAEEAVKFGFANELLPGLQNEPDWFDLGKVPAIGKLLQNDYRTLVNCKRLINQAKNNE